MYTRDEARALVETVIDLAAPDDVEVNLTGGERSGTRWANSDITTNLLQYDRQLTATVRLDGRAGTATTRDFSDAGLQQLVADARAAAGAARELELPALLGPQEYVPVDAALPGMLAFGPAERALLVRESIAAADAKGVLGYGYVPKLDQTTCRANSAGLFAYYRAAEASFVLTCRMPDGAGSGWAGTTGIKDITAIDARALTDVAADKALLSRSARPMPAGRYSVILEPRANARFLQPMLNPLASGTGFFADREPGEQLFSELFTLRSEIGHPVLRQTPIRQDFRPAGPVTWVERGALREFGPGQAANIGMSLVMAGTYQSLDDIIASTRRGLLVSFFWYIRGVPSDEQPLLSTGMTRDGLFLVEDGEVVGAVQNFRWNMSPLAAYRNLTAVGEAVPMHLGESYDVGPNGMIPPVRIEEFYMTSPSPAVE
jgi:predicted Zn-dependent protease